MRGKVPAKRVFFERLLEKRNIWPIECQRRDQEGSCTQLNREEKRERENEREIGDRGVGCKQSPTGGVAEQQTRTEGRARTVYYRKNHGTGCGDETSLFCSSSVLSDSVSSQVYFFFAVGW
ncbi:unnamed protein product [Calypogeia fissa]